MVKNSVPSLYYTAASVLLINRDCFATAFNHSGYNSLTQNCKSACYQTRSHGFGPDMLTNVWCVYVAALQCTQWQFWLQIHVPCVHRHAQYMYSSSIGYFCCGNIIIFPQLTVEYDVILYEWTNMFYTVHEYNITL